MSVTAFDRVAHLVRVPVLLGGTPYRFLVDTGIGITVVGSALVERGDVRPLGETYAGRRMSGQVVEAPLVELPELRLGAYAVTGHVAAVADFGAAFDGILGPLYVGDRVVTVDPAAGTVAVEEYAPDGIVVPVDVRRDAWTATPFADLVLPSGRTVHVEVDTGSDRLILDAGLRAECEVGEVSVRTGVDETGHGYERHDATLIGAVHLAAAPGTAQHDPRVMFQEIVHDGLVGTDFLFRYAFSLDLGRERMVLSAPREP